MCVRLFYQKSIYLSIYLSVLLTCASEPSSGLGTAFISTAALGLESVCTCTNMSVAQTPGVHASALTRLFRRRSRSSNAAVNTRLPSLDWWYLVRGRVRGRVRVRAREVAQLGLVVPLVHA